jgi:hypothetical protein
MNEEVVEVMFFLVANSRHLATKKKRLASPTKGLLRFFLKIRHISRKKTFRSRQI